MEKNRRLFELVHWAQQRAHTIFKEEADAEGLDVTVRQVQILDAVGSFPGITQSEVVGITGIDRSTTTELAGRMVKRGLLIRSRNKKDGRAYEVALSDHGIEVLRKAKNATDRAELRFSAPLTEDDDAQLRRCLTVLADKGR